MRIKKAFISIILMIPFVLMASAVQDKKTVTITGKVTGDTKGHNNIFYYSSGIPKDSVAITNGQFEITLPFTETYTQLFYTQYEIRGNRSYRPFPLLIDAPGKISIEMNIAEGFFSAKISGLQTTVLFHSFLKQQNDVYKKINDALVSLNGKGWVAPSDPLYGKINTSRDSLTKLYMGGMILDFVRQNKDSFAGVYVLSTAGKGSLDVNQLENALNLLPPEMQKTSEGIKFAAYIMGVKNTRIGSSVKNFVLNDQNGKAFSFEQLKGKYVWIDFWASWCHPCKMAFPKMRELYSKYKDKKFEILGISTDTKIEPWLEALKTIIIPWPQVWDNKKIMSEFAVTAVPTSFLIDPNGKILLKEIGFDPENKGKIEKKLEELFVIK